MIDERIPFCLCATWDESRVGLVQTLLGVQVLRDHCAGCGGPVMTSPPTRRLFRAGMAQPICRACIPPEFLVVPMVNTEDVRVPDH